MAIRPVRELPERASVNKGESFVAADMREFVRRGMEVAVLEYDGRKPSHVTAAAKRYIKLHPKHLRGCKAGVRGGKCYVWREAGR